MNEKYIKMYEEKFCEISYFFRRKIAASEIKKAGEASIFMTALEQPG